jgi:iron(III) transport system substrate-binding protein
MVIYASHPTKLVDYFVNKFKEKYGSIEVDLITGGTGELLGRVQAEKNRPQGDIMFRRWFLYGRVSTGAFFTV